MSNNGGVVFFMYCMVYSGGMMIKSRKYSNNPGIPPGINAIKKPRRNQKGLIPKKSASPPQTPRKTRFLRGRLKDRYEVLILSPFNS